VTGGGDAALGVEVDGSSTDIGREAASEVLVEARR
jgi:hypothetical protein